LLDRFDKVGIGADDDEVGFGGVGVDGLDLPEVVEEEFVVHFFGRDFKSKLSCL